MKPLFVAELSANHLGDLGRALAVIEAAAKAGADAVKFQTFTPEQMTAPGAVIKSGPWSGREALQLYREAHTPRKWHPELFACARKLGLIAFSSVFHPDDVDFLETLGCPMYKIASFELTDLSLISYAASTSKPLIMSTGMASQLEISAAVTNAKAAGCSDITLLKCTSSYPAPASEANLLTLASLRCAPFVKAVGLSDHTEGIGVAVAAAALGADLIEKHLTLARDDGGPDAAFSMEPLEFAQMVTESRRAVAAIGGVRYGPTAAEAEHFALRRAPGGKRM